MNQKNNKRNKKKLKIKNILVALSLLILIVLIIFGLSKILSKAKEVIIFKDYYLSSDSNEITLYTFDEENEIMTELEQIYRGTQVSSNDKTKTIADTTYTEIKLNDDVYYVKKDNLVSNEKEAVKETTKYVRTSITVYKNETESKIESFIKKGNQLEIIDYDYLDDEGNVNMYKVKFDDIEGWVYQKYLVDTEIEA